MGKYLFQASYTSEGVRGLIRDGASNRRTAVETTVTRLGGQVEAFYYALGDVDVYAVVDLPDNVSANAVSLVINRTGVVHLKTTVLMTPEEVDQAIGRQVDYRAPGT